MGSFSRLVRSYWHLLIWCRACDVALLNDSMFASCSSFTWSQEARPAHNFHSVHLAPGRAVRPWQELKKEPVGIASASRVFTMDPTSFQVLYIRTTLGDGCNYDSISQLKKEKYLPLNKLSRPTHEWQCWDTSSGHWTSKCMLLEGGKGYRR